MLAMHGAVAETVPANFTRNSFLPFHGGSFLPFYGGSFLPFHGGAAEWYHGKAATGVVRGD